MRANCKGISLAIFVLIYFVITIQSRKKPPKAKTRGRAAAVLNQKCGPTEAYHNETDKCYEIGTQGPCPDTMKFNPDSELDIADCDCDSDCSRSLHYVYWAIEKRCYAAFEKGPCGEGDWLVLGTSWEAECRKSPCIEDLESGGGLENRTESISIWTLADCICIEMLGIYGLADVMASTQTESSFNVNTETESVNNDGLDKERAQDKNCSCFDYKFNVFNSTANYLKIPYWMNFSTLFFTGSRLMIYVVSSALFAETK